MIEQLSLEDNTLLAEHPDLKNNVTILVNKHIELWSHIEGRKPYGSAQGLEFEINLINPDMCPIKQKPRNYNELQQKYLQLQILDWERAGKF